MLKQDQNKTKIRPKAKLVSDFTIIPNHLVSAIWPKCLPHIIKGEKHWKMFYTLESMLDNLITGRQQLWCAIEGPKVIGVVITQLDKFPETLALRYQYLGGEGFDPDHMLPWVRKMEIWAIQQGATLVDFMGRDAHKRLLAALGYQEVGRVYRKQLVNENNISKELQ